MTATDDIDLQNLWMSLQKKDWRVLAVVPAMRQIAALEIANAIAQISWQYRGDPTVVMDLRETNLRLVDYQKKEVDEHVKKGESVIIALSSIQQNPTTIPLARVADTAVLVVRLGETPMKAAQRTIEEIGHDRFAGTILAKKKSLVRVTQRLPMPLRLPERLATRNTVKLPVGGVLKP